MADLGVRQAELVTHASNVEALADRVATAAGAGRAVRAGTGAYGQLCGMVPVLLNLLQDILVDAVDGCAESLHDDGARLRTTAADYEASDESSANAFKGIG